MVLQIWNIENGILNLGNADLSNESFLLVADQKSRGHKDEKTKGRIHDAGRDGVRKKKEVYLLLTSEIWSHGWGAFE